jgi:hypothetical protein
MTGAPEKPTCPTLPQHQLLDRDRAAIAVALATWPEFWRFGVRVLLDSGAIPSRLDLAFVAEIEAAPGQPSDDDLPTLHTILQLAYAADLSTRRGRP